MIRSDADMSYTVKQVAELAGVSVRTLHHYDQIGLLEPTKVTPAGYRIYTDPDLERLQQILFFRELGFELRQIKEIIDSPGFDRERALVQHRELLREKRSRIDSLIETIDRTIKHMERNEEMDRGSMFEGFDKAKVEEQIAKYHDEAVEKYGNETVEESERRVRGMSQEQMDAVSAESNDINQSLAALMDSHKPEDQEVQHQVERWYNLLNRYFAEYTPGMFRGLGDLYVNDSRFTENYDKVRPGLAQFLRDGMHAFADRSNTEG